MKTIIAIHLNSLDSCVTLTSPADAGDIVSYVESGSKKTVITNTGIPSWHKVAISPVQKGGKVYKYGAVIGIALENIAVGDHVHTHNMRSPGIG